VSFDHSDDSGDMDYFLGLVRRGYSIGMDHVDWCIRPQHSHHDSRKPAKLFRFVLSAVQLALSRSAALAVGNPLQIHADRFSGHYGIRQDHEKPRDF
jgi:hypothetical protein